MKSVESTGLVSGSVGHISLHSSFQMIGAPSSTILPKRAASSIRSAMGKFAVVQKVRQGKGEEGVWGVGEIWFGKASSGMSLGSAWWFGITFFLTLQSRDLPCVHCFNGEKMRRLSSLGRPQYNPGSHVALLPTILKYRYNNSQCCSILSS